MAQIMIEVPEQLTERLDEVKAHLSEEVTLAYAIVGDPSRGSPLYFGISGQKPCSARNH